jgi:hypothetical protein
MASKQTVTVLVDGLGYRQPAGVHDEYGRERTDHLLAGFGDEVELDAKQADRFRRLGAVGDADDLEAVQYLNRVRAARPAERRRAYELVADGATMYDAVLEAFHIDEEGLEDAAQEAAAGPEGDETELRAELDELDKAGLQARAAAQGLEMPKRATNAELIDAIVAAELGTAPADDDQAPAGDDGDGDQDGGTDGDENPQDGPESSTEPTE